MSKKHENLLDIFKKDLEAARSARAEVDYKIANWKKWYNGEPYGNEIKGKSSIVDRTVKKQSEWQHASLIEPFISTPDIIKCNPVTFEDSESARKMEILLNTQFCRQFSRYNFLTKAIRVLDQEGTCIVRVGWEMVEKEIEEFYKERVPSDTFLEVLEQNPELGNASVAEIEQMGIPVFDEIERSRIVTKKVIDHPTAIVCRNEDIFIDPTCEDSLDECQFIIHRYEVDMSSLIDARDRGLADYFGLELLKEEMANKEYENIYNRDYNYNFEDIPRRKMTMYEYWGNYDLDNDGYAEPIVCSWINDRIIRLENNILPDEKPPFIVVPFTHVPFSIYGESNAELLGDIQKIQTAFKRGIMDNVASVNNGQKGIRKGVLDPENLKRYQSGQSYQFNTTFNPQTDIIFSNYNEIPGSIFNYMAALNNEAESITGISSFNTGINGNAMGSTATSIRTAVDSSSTRRLNLVRNISENLVKPILRKWIAYNAEYLDEETQIRITNEEFMRINKDDINGNIDIELTISTSDDNQAKANELAFLLQTIGNSTSFEFTKMIMIHIARLYRMPALAKSLEEFEPQPDPMQQAMLEAQIRKIMSETMNNEAKAVENQATTAKKEADANLSMAKARHLESKTDLDSLKYIKDYTGQAHKEDLEKIDRANEVKLTQEALRTLGRTNKQNL